MTTCSKPMMICLMLTELPHRQQIARRNASSLCLPPRMFLTRSCGILSLPCLALAHRRLPSQARTSKQVHRVCHPAHDYSHFLRRQRLRTLEHGLLQWSKVEIGNCCHSSPKNDDLRVEKADEVCHRKSEKSPGAVEDVHCKRVTLSGGSRNLMRRDFRD